MWFNGAWEGLVVLAVLLAVSAAILGGLIVWAAPIVWGWLQPIIHQATA